VLSRLPGPKSAQAIGERGARDPVHADLDEDDTGDGRLGKLSSREIVVRDNVRTRRTNQYRVGLRHW
jgi:hypothetical protein